MRIALSKGILEDFWGGLAAMLVALPASIAFGVAIYAPLGEGSTALGAMAGILGATAIGIVAPIFGGTQRLISAPCAPAAAVMGALALELVHQGPGSAPMSPEHVLVLMTLAALMSGGLQVLYGTLGGGTLIKYIPYPVVTGYLSGVGVVIFLKQLPGFFGWAEGTGLAAGLGDPGLWRWPGLIVGLVTILVMLSAPRIIKAVPAAILGLLAGVGAYFLLGVAYPELLSIQGNPLLIGELGGQGGSFVDAVTSRWSGLGGLGLQDLELILMPALTLSVLLSIDTLKTCILVDALTHSRHHSNREMVGQGLANLCSAAIGGMPGAGTSGPTLVNIASGGRTRLSSLLEGIFVLIAFLVLGGLVAWAPIGALAGILIVVSFRMFDWSIFRLLRQRSTILDFLVIVTVIGVAVGVGLIMASGVGIALAILLFIREQIRGSVVHRRIEGGKLLSRQRRLPEEVEILERRGAETLVCELEGNLFFGTTDKFYTQLEQDLKRRRFLVLDMRRVRGVDFTAVHVLDQIESRLAERGAQLLFSNLPKALPTGQDLRVYFDEVGLVKPSSGSRAFDQLSDALEWVENRILEEEGRLHREQEPPLNLRDIDFLRGRKEKTMRALEACVETCSYEPGEFIFRQGDQGDEIYLISRGSVRIELALEEGGDYHIATFGRGDFFGDMAFLDRGERSANAVAAERSDLLVISRERFEAVAEKHPRLGREFFSDLARSLAMRLRHADTEIRALEEA